MAVDNSIVSPMPATEQGGSAFLKESDCGTLILDEVGNICSCGTAAGKLFGGKPADYMGKPISSLIPDLVLSNTSQSYSARYLAHLCADGGWRKFDAIDLTGHGFPIEINLSLVETKNQGVFLLNVRRPKLSA